MGEGLPFGETPVVHRSLWGPCGPEHLLLEREKPCSAASLPERTIVPLAPEMLSK